MDQPSTTAAIAQANLTAAGLLATARTQFQQRECSISPARRGAVRAENKVLMTRLAKIHGNPPACCRLAVPKPMAGCGPRLPRSAVPDGSAYWRAPAARTRAREVVGAAESDPTETCPRLGRTGHSATISRGSHAADEPPNSGLTRNRSGCIECPTVYANRASPCPTRGRV